MGRDLGDYEEWKGGRKGWKEGWSKGGRGEPSQVALAHQTQTTPLLHTSTHHTPQGPWDLTHTSDTQLHKCMSVCRLCQCRLFWTKTDTDLGTQAGSPAHTLQAINNKAPHWFLTLRSYHTHVGECVPVWARPQCACLNLHVSTRVNRSVSTVGLEIKAGWEIIGTFFPWRNSKAPEADAFSQTVLKIFPSNL